MDTEFDPSQFDDRYKLAIVSSYSDLAQFTRDQLWRSTLEEREAAFARCLNAKHLRLMHIKHLHREAEADSTGLPPYSPTERITTNG